MTFAERLFWLYLPLTGLVVFVAFQAGVDHFDSTCTGDGDCDLGALMGAFWALIALVVWLGCMVATEVVIRTGRPSARSSLD
jgi:hypothetical protein